MEWSPLRLQLSLVRGRRIVRSASAPGEIVASAAAAESTAAAVTLLLEPLEALITELGAAGARATLIYRTSDTAVSVHSCPRAAGRAKSRRAALLALGDIASFPLLQSPHAIERLAIDARKGPGETAQSHALLSAEPDHSAEQLAGWLEQAGLTVEALIPADAIVMTAAVEDAMARSPGRSALTLYVGDESVVIAGASGGRLRFARQLGIGLDTLASALARDRRAAEGAGTRMSLQAALQALRQQGIPDPAARCVSPGDRAILPLLQPILQRWILDVRQSVRFGLGAEQPPLVRLLGPGAAVPRLAEVIATECGLQLDAAPDAASKSATEDLLRLGRAPAALLPLRLGAEHEQRRLRIACWAGAACAAAAVAMMGAQVRLDLEREQRQLDQLRAELQQLGPQITTRNRARDLQQQVRALEDRVAERAGAAPNWAPVLAAVAAATPEAIRLDRLNLTAPRAETPSIVLSGSVAAPTDGRAINTLRAYREALQAVPVIQDAALGSTNLIRDDEGASRQFELRLRLVDAPWLRLIEQAAVTEETP
ncbi:MAG: hypothetical protein ACF8R7_03405 [Phycisphaerales bacterium JB039]